MTQLQLIASERPIKLTDKELVKQVKWALAKAENDWLEPHMVTKDKDLQEYTKCALAAIQAVIDWQNNKGERRW